MLHTPLTVMLEYFPEGMLVNCPLAKLPPVHV